MVVIYLCMYMCVCWFVQTESDLGCPGGKARIIHKESDIITAFAINKVQPFHTDVTKQFNTQCEKSRTSSVYHPIWPILVFLFKPKNVHLQ